MVIPNVKEANRRIRPIKEEKVLKESSRRSPGKKNKSRERKKPSWFRGSPERKEVREKETEMKRRKKKEYHPCEIARRIRWREVVEKSGERQVGRCLTPEEAIRSDGGRCPDVEEAANLVNCTEQLAGWRKSSITYQRRSRYEINKSFFIVTNILNCEFTNILTKHDNPFFNPLYKSVLISYMSPSEIINLSIQS